MPAPRNGDEDIIEFPEDPFLFQTCHFRVLIIVGRSSKSLAIVPVLLAEYRSKMAITRRCRAAIPELGSAGLGKVERDALCIIWGIGAEFRELAKLFAEQGPGGANERGLGKLHLSFPTSETLPHQNERRCSSEPMKCDSRKLVVDAKSSRRTRMQETNDCCEERDREEPCKLRRPTLFSRATMIGQVGRSGKGSFFWDCPR
jgi:hypothetical protein